MQSNCGRRLFFMRLFSTLGSIATVLVNQTYCPAELSYPSQWATQIGSDQNDEFLSLTVDHAENIYGVGRTYGSVGSSQQGNGDLLICKFDADGQLLWSKQSGDRRLNIVWDASTDSQDSLFICGQTGNAAGRDDAYLSKYDSNGTLLWSRLFDGTGENDYGRSLINDSLGNVYMVGESQKSAGFHDFDAFVRKYNGDGDLIWSRQVATSGDESANSVTLDGFGNLYIAGHISGSGNFDAFLAKFDSNGEFKWTRQLGTSASDIAWAVGVDSAGSAYITGQTAGALGSANGGADDAFLAKYSQDGALQWTKQFGSAGTDVGSGLAVDANGNVLVGGWTSGRIGVVDLGLDDAFVTTFDADGQPMWTRQFGSDQLDQSSAIILDSFGNVLVSGSTQGVIGQEHFGALDGWITKFSVPEPPSLVSALMIVGIGVVCLRRCGAQFLNRRE